MKIEIELSDKQEATLKAWMKEIDQKVIEDQRQFYADEEEFNALTMNGTKPYSGTIGGALTWMITPTSIGRVIRVKYWDHELDLSDYESW